MKNLLRLLVILWMDCEEFVHLLFTPLKQILPNIYVARLFYLHNEKNGLGEGCLGNRIIRYFKNRNTWPCFLFLVSLETVLTVLLPSQVRFWKGWLKGLGLHLPDDCLACTLSLSPSCISSLHLDWLDPHRFVKCPIVLSFWLS